MTTKEIFKDMSDEELSNLLKLKARRKGSSASVIMQEILRRSLFEKNHTVVRN